MIHGSTGNKVETIKWKSSLGEKIDKEVNQVVQIRGCEEEGTFEGSEKGQDSNTIQFSIIILDG